MVFARVLTERVPSSLNEGRRLTRIISNHDCVFQELFIKMKDYIVKTTRSLRAECLPNGFQVLYLFDCMKRREPWTNSQEV